MTDKTLIRAIAVCAELKPRVTPEILAQLRRDAELSLRSNRKDRSQAYLRQSELQVKVLAEAEDLIAGLPGRAILDGFYEWNKNRPTFNPVPLDSVLDPEKEIVPEARAGFRR